MSQLVKTSFIEHLIKITEDRLITLPENCQDWKSELEDPFNQFKKLMLTSEFSAINIPIKLPEVEQLKVFNAFERLIKAKISHEGLWNYLTHEIEFENYCVDKESRGRKTATITDPEWAIWFARAILRKAQENED